MNELYHSDTYLGETYNDGLYHFKYAYKEKMPNGKYRYYYHHKDEKTKQNLLYVKEKGNINSKYGVYKNYTPDTVHTYTVKKSNKLLSNTVQSKTQGTIRNVGKLEQGADLVTKTIKDISKQTNKKAKKVIKKVNKALKKIKHKVVKYEKSSNK